MRKFVLDEISRSDMEKIRDYLNQNAILSEVDGLYWVELADEHLDHLQFGHEQCKPYRFAVELCDDSVHLEMLIRSATTMRCECIKYANRTQRDVIIRFGETIIRDCDIST